MAIILQFRGRPALSAFRLHRLQQQLSVSGPVTLVAEYRHFVEAKRTLSPDERQRLDLLLTYGPKGEAAPPGLGHETG